MDEKLNEALRASVMSDVSEQRQRTDALEKLKRDAALYGYKVATDVPYDGNCYFTAVGHAVGKSEEQTRSLRRDLTTFLQTNVCIFILYCYILIYHLFYCTKVIITYFNLTIIILLL